MIDRQRLDKKLFASGIAVVLASICQTVVPADSAEVNNGERICTEAEKLLTQVQDVHYEHLQAAAKEQIQEP